MVDGDRFQAKSPSLTPVHAGGGSTAVRRFYVMDRLGSSLLVLAPNGTVAARRVFEPFGRVLAEDSTETTPRLFTGQAHQAETGFYDYGARWYDPAVGRYLSVDPAPPQPGAPQQHNRYSYVRNDPVNRVDPTGTISGAPVGSLGGLSFGNVGGNLARLQANAIFGRGAFKGLTPSVRNAQLVGRGPESNSGAGESSASGNDSDSSGSSGGSAGSSSSPGMGADSGSQFGAALTASELAALANEVKQAVRSGLDPGVGAAVLAKAIQSSARSSLSTQSLLVSVSIASAGAATAKSGILALGAIAGGPAIGLVVVPIAFGVVVFGVGLTAVGVESTLDQINVRTGSNLSLNVFGGNLIPAVPTGPRQRER